MNRIRTMYVPLLAVVFAAAIPAVAGESKFTDSLESVVTMRIDGEVEVGADGRVKSHKLDTALSPEMRTPVEKAIAAWRFSTPTMNGKPVETARARMRIALVATEREDKNYVFKIENVTFDQPAKADGPIAGDVTIASRRAMPRVYPGGNVLVSMQFHIDPSGKVLDVAPTQCTILAMARRQNATTMCKTLERASASALRSWTFNVAPGGDGQPITAMVGLWFVMDDSSPANVPGQWRRELRSPYRPAPWEKADAPRMGTADVTDGGLMRPYAGLKLEEGIGKTL